jgi:hypothetical protein
MHVRFKRSKGVGTNGILECKNPSENESSVQQSQPDAANPNTAESMVKTSTVPAPISICGVFDSTLGRWNVATL